MEKEAPPSIPDIQASPPGRRDTTHTTFPPRVEDQEAIDEIQITKAEYEALAAFRYALRRFLHFSEQTARNAGVTPQQHQVLLAIKGFPGRESATISELAERLQMRQHSMVGLIDRMEAQQLVRREQGTTDHRQVYVMLTPAGEELLRKLALTHLQELRGMREALQPPILEEYLSRGSSTASKS